MRAMHGAISTSITALRHLALALIALATLAMPAHAQDSAWPLEVAAAQGDPASMNPPRTGWTDVTLPDDWSLRWPRYDGVVWYRVTWNQDDVTKPTAAFIDYFSLAGLVQLNGAEILRDPHLTEPLSRMWNVPRYLRLPQPMLHVGENVLAIRVSGQAPYQPGLGPLRIGPDDAMLKAYGAARLWRQDMQLFSLALGASLAGLFFLLWLLRPREQAFGWYAVWQVWWGIVGLNQILRSPWPFRVTDHYVIFQTASLLLFTGSYFVFTLRFCGEKWPRREGIMWAVMLVAALAVAFAPHDDIGATRGLVFIVALLTGMVAAGILIYLALRSGRRDLQLLSIAAALDIAAGVHDVFALLGIVKSNFYYTNLAQETNALCVAAFLAWSFVNNLRRIEGFNVELSRNAAAARAELAQTLSLQHERDVAEARGRERMQIVHDLHDGLGGALVSSISMLDHAPEASLRENMREQLRQMREDLRLIIAATDRSHAGQCALTDLLVPLRHRQAQVFDLNDVESGWHFSGLESCILPTEAALNVMRVLQEAMTNVLKHGRATKVDVHVTSDGRRLHMAVIDNGVGFSTAQTGGVGMASMRSRIEKLGGTFRPSSDGAMTKVECDVPL